MNAELPIDDADSLLEALNATRDWPKMASLFSKAIARIRSHEQERVHMLVRIADLERRIAAARTSDAA